ncbi:DUF4291 family protein [Streptomyces sp. NPDC007851]|uniref:DUF4291 family protein n=1 Tax=Streptomyces sp. NPDC007851 TaxID=3155008 RepID=UPI0033FFD4AB
MSRAAYDESTITGYQAYSPQIGLPAAREGRFSGVWKRDRKTWMTGLDLVAEACLHPIESQKDEPVLPTEFTAQSQNEIAEWPSIHHSRGRDLSTSNSGTRLLGQSPSCLRFHGGTFVALTFRSLATPTTRTPSPRHPEIEFLAYGRRGHFREHGEPDG